MIVVDTNVIAYLLIPGAQTESARRALMRDSDWAAPALWRSELRNVLALYLRQGHSSLREAVSIQTAAEELLAGREYMVDSSDVLELASRSRRSAYDCEFMSLATAMGVSLVTSDTQLLASFPARAVALSVFAAGEGDT